MSSAAYVGIDMGGTGIRLLCRIDGQAVGDSSFRTSALDPLTPAQRIDRLTEEVHRLVPGKAWLAAVGIGATGPVDLRTGEIDNDATLPQLSGINVRTQLQRRLGVPVYIDNDCVAAAIAEWSLLELHPASRLLMIILGTGIGGCLLIDGQPLRSSTGTHPEIGHLPVFEAGPACYCGLRGCWEPQASRTALQNQLAELLRPTGEDILTTAAARASEESAVRDCFASYGSKVGRGLASLQVAYGPTLIVLGGGAARFFAHYEAGMRREPTQSCAYCPPGSIVASQLGAPAGAMGAAVIAERSVDR